MKALIAILIFFFACGAVAEFGSAKRAYDRGFEDGRAPEIKRWNEYIGKLSQSNADLENRLVEAEWARGAIFSRWAKLQMQVDPHHCPNY